MHDDRPDHSPWQPALPLPRRAETRQPVVEVVRSGARRRTSSARVRDGRVLVRVPAHLTRAEEHDVVTGLLRRLREKAERAAPATTLPSRVAPRPTRTRRGPRGDRDLAARADAVAARWLAPEGVRADQVVWSHRMSTRWASVTMPPGRVRVSHRLADAPDAVLDNILLHELAHLVQRGHGVAFHALVDRDPASADVAAWLAARTRAELRAALGLD